MLRLYFFGLLLLVGFVQASPVDSDLAYIEDIRSASPRIVGGWEAKDGQFPYTVSIRMVGPTGGVGACTGSILTNQWILTAAHCLARRFTYVVRLGQTNITKPGYMVEATERYIHEGYNQESTGVQTEDIGLLKLDHYIPYGGGIVPDILYWTYQRGMTQQECRTWYPNSQVINVQTICSQYYDDPSQNPCTGDSGGPLTMVDVDGKVTQVGIMSFGSQRGCNTPNPQGFVRPDYYQDWIEKQTGISFDWDVEELESLQNNESA